MTYTSTEQERTEFEARFKHLDLTQEPDAWGVPRYKHGAISLAWEAWQTACAKTSAQGTMTAACPKCRSRTMLLAETHLLAAAPQAAAHGMEQDAARYQALVESGNFAPSPFDNGMWGLRASSSPSTKAELDAAVDRVIAAQAKQGAQS